MNGSTVLINIDVPDIDAATRFYCDAFSLRPGRRLDADTQELLGFGAPVYLLRKRDGSAGAAGSARDYRRHWTPLHLDLVVPDIDAAVQRATGAGATLEQPAAAAPFGRIAMLADPFGHGFCIVEFNEQGYDAA